MIKIFKYDITYTIFIFLQFHRNIYIYVFISIFIIHVLYSRYVAYLFSFFKKFHTFITKIYINTRKEF